MILCYEILHCFLKRLPRIRGANAIWAYQGSCTCESTSRASKDREAEIRPYKSEVGVGVPKHNQPSHVGVDHKRVLPYARNKQN